MFVALNVLASALRFNNRAIVLQRVGALRLPAIYQWPEIAEHEGLLGYGPRIVHIYRDIIGRKPIMGVRRREVIALLGSVSVARPVAAQAQETGRIYSSPGHQGPPRHQSGRYSG